ncbi:MAG: hypothetical protein FJX60_09695 [Alphaproteobacteria bacterium]|nr:hypothetical protein [Alphaproteobacteria bacterium]
MIGVRVFSAPSTEEGYRLLQARFGADVSILRVERDLRSTGYLFTVSVPKPNGAEPGGRAQETRSRAASIMGKAGFSSTVIGHVAGMSGNGHDEGPLQVIGRGLADLVRVGSFLEFARRSRFVLFIGSPGAGKTTTLAKAAAWLTASGEKVALVNYDVGRLGGGSQLSKLSSIYNAPLVDLDGAASKIDPEAFDQCSIILCDTPGFNPWRFTEIDELLAEAERVGGGTVLVCAAGLDADETADMLVTARRLSLENIIMTRCDMSRKLGSLLTPIIQENYTILGCLRSRALSEEIVQPSGASIAALICEQAGRSS